MADAPDLNGDDIVSVMDTVLSGWDERRYGDATTVKSRRRRTAAQVSVVLALGCHVHEVVHELRPVLPGGLRMVHMPLVRAAYETTLRALWLDHVPDAAEAWVNEDLRQRAALRAEMNATVSLAALSDRISHADDPRHPTTDLTAMEAAKVHEMASRLGIDGAYAHYRIRCQMTHPSGLVADEYLRISDQYAFTLVPKPGPLDASWSWSWLLTACLIWSGRAVDYSDGNRRRSELREAARRLGTKAEVPLRPKVARRT